MPAPKTQRGEPHLHGSAHFIPGLIHLGEARFTIARDLGRARVEVRRGHNATDPSFHHALHGIERFFERASPIVYGRNQVAVKVADTPRLSRGHP